MSGLFGSRAPKTKPQYSGLQVQTSASTLPVPICYGQNRMAPNLIWYGDFKANKQKQKTGKGGNQTSVTYTYSASVILGLCEGEIEEVSRAYIDQGDTDETGIADLGFTAFLGTDPQAPWGYLTSSHPDEALGYVNTAYLACANYDLGQSASLPQHNFELKALLWNTAESGNGDADAALVIEDLLTNTRYGTLLPLSVIDLGQLLSGPDATTTGDSTFQTYCRAMGFGMSPFLTSQEAANNIIDRWAKLMNSAIVWTGAQLKFIPYGDEVVTANGVTFLPLNTIRYSLSSDDFIGSNESDPLIMRRSDPATAKNSYPLEVRDRENQYNMAPVEWRDQNLIELFRLQAETGFKADEICDLEMASVIVSLMGQRQAYVRNQYDFKLPSNYIRLEPMDLVEVFDPAWGFITLRILDIEEEDEGDLVVMAEEFSQGVASSQGFGIQPVEGGSQNQLAAPGPANPPMIFEPPSSLAGSTPQVWMAVSGGDGTTVNENWGGCFVLLSIDDVTYQTVGVIDNPARMGKLSQILATFGGTNPDTAHTASVDMSMSGGELISVSTDDALNGVTLMRVGDEFFSYETATLTGVNQYDLDTLYRALYNSTVSAHSIGAPICRVDDAIFKYDLPLQYIGQTVYIKLQSFNVWNQATEDASTLATYTFVPTGGGVPEPATGIAAVGGYQQNTITWTASPTASVTGYNVYAFNGTTTDFNDATLLVGNITGTLYPHAGLPNTDTWTYWVTAVSIGGESAPDGPVTATTVTP